MKKIVLLTVILLGLFISCDDDESVKGHNMEKISRMNIQDATTLFIAPANFAQIQSTRSASDGSNVLFLITKDGIIKQVSYLDENGKEITAKLEPTLVLPIEDSNYFFVQFVNSLTYLVNEKTGAVYETPGIPLDEGGDGIMNYINDNNIKIDANGNIYYLKSSRVYKIDITDENNVTEESLTPESDEVSMYMVSNAGDLYYRYYRDGYLARLRNTSGKLFPFSPSDDGFFYPSRESIAFNGFDGNIHVLDRRALYAINFTNDGSYETTDILWDDCSDDKWRYGNLGGVHGMGWSENGFYYHFCLSNTVYDMVRECYLIKLHDRYLLISCGGNAMVVDSKDDSSLFEMAVHDVTGGMTISQLEYNDSYVYCCGRNGNNYSLLRINPYTYESEPLVRDNDYEIYSFTVLDDNTIIFNGLRLSDGKIIIANIDNNGQVKVIKETGNTKVTLHRIQ